jgi:glycosyltransferase involved in cell wall biosynthesis
VNERDLRVVHLLAPAPFGGLESVVRHLAKAQREAGARVHVAVVVAPGEAGHPFIAAGRAEGIDLHVLEVEGRGYLRERALVADVLERTRATVLHTHGYRPDIVDAPVARRRGIATVTTAHGFTGNGWRNRLYEIMQRRSFRHFDAVVAVSRGLVQRLVGSGVPAERVHLVPNAQVAGAERTGRSEARRALGFPAEGPPLIGWVGRLGPEKGPDIMVRSMAEDVLHDAHLCFVGEGRMSDPCEDLASELGVGPRVHWAGAIPDAGRFMAAFDVLVLSSRTEGTPMVLFEADAAGVVVVATSVGGVPAVLGDGWNLVPPDDPPALALAVARALHDDEAAHEARERARHRIRERFDVSRWVEAHLALYRSLLRTDRASTATRGIGR